MSEKAWRDLVRSGCGDRYSSHLVSWEVTPGQIPLVGVPPELLNGDEHLDVVAAEAGVDPAGHGELEAAEAAHEEVNTVPAHCLVTWSP